MSDSAPPAPRQILVISGATRSRIVSKFVGAVPPNCALHQFWSAFNACILPLCSASTAWASCPKCPMPVLRELLFWASLPLVASIRARDRALYSTASKDGSYWATSCSIFCQYGLLSAKPDGNCIL